MIHQLTQPLAKTQEHPGSQIGPRGKNRLAALKPEPKGRSIPDHLFDNDITIDFFSCREVYGSFTHFALFKANGLVI